MEAVTFHLEVFDGPLDLLLNLLSKNKVDIKDIPISDILNQYLDYIKAMRQFDLAVASEFITMAAQLMYIKSKMLLPVYEDEAPEDPRAALVEALLEYQRFKEAGGYLNAISEIGRDIFVKQAEILDKSNQIVTYNYTYNVLVSAIENIFERSERKLPPPTSSFHGIIDQEMVPVDGKLRQIVMLLGKHDYINFERLVLSSTSRSEIVALFLAVLELSKTRKILINDSDEGYVISLNLAEEEAQSDGSTQRDTVRA